jgi:hypothetical protein
LQSGISCERQSDRGRQASAEGTVWSLGKDSLIEEDKRINEHAKGKLERFRWPLAGGSSLVVWVLDESDSMTSERSVGQFVVSSHRSVEVVNGPVRNLEIVVDVPQERRLRV